MKWRILAAFLAVTAGAMAKPDLRYPVSLARHDGKVYTANERSGTVSIVDLANGHTREIELGGRPVDLLAEQDRVVIADAGVNQLRIFQTGKTIKELPGALCTSEPTRLVSGGYRQTLAVSSTWGRRVGIYQAKTKQFGRLGLLRELDLEFSPRELLFFAGGKQLLITDAFGGRYAVYDLEKEKFLAKRQIPAHNIRGLALDPGGTDIVFSHQILNPLARTTFNDIHWGVLMANVARSIPIANLRSQSGDVLRNSVLHRLGTTGPAAGDPGAISIQPDRVTISLTGVGAILTGSNFNDLKRIEVGSRPTALLTSGDEALVANTFSDSISVVDLEGHEVSKEIHLGEQRKLTAAEEGERIFFDAKRSHNGWLSCHSCHTDGHSNGQLNDNLGDGSFGAPKRVLSLLGVGKTAPWAWNGSIRKLEDQISKSIKNTMQGSALAKTETSQLKAYLMTLRLPDRDLVGEKEDEGLVRGRKLFAKMDCFRCHNEPSYTSEKSYEVGLRDELGSQEFNPPSLRGLAYRARFFHDNRAESLVEVFYKHRHQLPEDLSPSELFDLSQFLQSL